MEYNDALNLLGIIYGNYPVSSGAGIKTFPHNVHNFFAFEDTVIESFRDENGDTVVLGWEGVLVNTNACINFGSPIKSITVTSGGKGAVDFLNFD